MSLAPLALLFRAASRRNPESLHLPVQIAALDAQHFGGPGHVALLLGQRAQDQIALELISRLVQRSALAGLRRGIGARWPAEAARVEERQVARRDGVAEHHDHQAL